MKMKRKNKLLLLGLSGDLGVQAILMKGLILRCLGPSIESCSSSFLTLVKTALVVVCCLL
jgi:hypothetical protein